MTSSDFPSVSNQSVHACASTKPIRTCMCKHKTSKEKEKRRKAVEEDEEDNKTPVEPMDVFFENDQVEEEEQDEEPVLGDVATEQEEHGQAEEQE